MPHVPLLKLRPELKDEDEADDDPGTMQNTGDQNGQSNYRTNAVEIEASSTFYNSELPAGATRQINGKSKKIKNSINTHFSTETHSLRKRPLFSAYKPVVVTVSTKHKRYLKENIWATK